MVPDWATNFVAMSDPERKKMYDGHNSQWTWAPIERALAAAPVRSLHPATQVALRQYHMYPLMDDLIVPTMRTNQDVEEKEKDKEEDESPNQRPILQDATGCSYEFDSISAESPDHTFLVRVRRMRGASSKRKLKIFRASKAFVNRHYTLDVRWAKHKIVLLETRPRLWAIAWVGVPATRSFITIVKS